MQQTFHHWASWSVLYTQCFAFDLSKLWCTRFALKRQNMSTTKKYTELVCRQVEIWTSTFCACSRTPVCQHAACSSIASTVFYLPNLCLTSPRVLSHQGSAMVRQNTWHAWVFRLEFAVMNRASIEDTTTNEDPADVSTEPASWALVVRVLDTQLFSCVSLPSTAKGFLTCPEMAGCFCRQNSGADFQITIQSAKLRAQEQRLFNEKRARCGNQARLGCNRPFTTELVEASFIHSALLLIFPNF